MADLPLKAAKIRSTIYDDTFRYAVSTIRAMAINNAEFVAPTKKADPAFQQQSPMGHTRLVADAQSILDHIRKACAVHKAPKFCSKEHVAADLLGAIEAVVSFRHNPQQLIARRQVVQNILSHLAWCLKPHQDLLSDMMPEHVLSLPSRCHIALIAAVAEAIQWPDELLVAKLVYGSPVTGDLPSSNLFRPKSKRATLNPKKFDQRRWVLQLEKSVFQRGSRLTKKGQKDAALVFDKSLAETKPVVIDGVCTGRSWARGPFTRSQMYEIFPNGFWPCRRFAVEQKGDIRPCDDARESGLNDAASLAEAIGSDGADFPSMMADIFFSFLGADTHLHGGCSDWKKAYRQCPVYDPSQSVVAQWDPYSRKVVYFVTHGHLFGQTCAVNSFNAVAKFLTCAARRLFGCCCGNYFDDHHVSEPSFAESSGQVSLTFLASTFGFLFDPEKHVPMQSKFLYLGVLHDYSSLHEGLMRVRILPDRRSNLVAECRSILKAGHLSPGRAASLRGKLYFASTAAYGKVGRAALQPILQRQERPSNSSRLTPALVLSLSFFITLLNNMPDKELNFKCQSRPPILVWSDASWEKDVGWLGFVVYDPDEGVFLHSDSQLPQHIRDFFVAKRQKIGQCEIAAAAAVYTSLPSLFRDRDVIHWIDNTSAISCLLHGYSGKLDSAKLVNAFHLFMAGLRSRVHFEYVESKANVADLPSRQSFELLLSGLHSSPVPLNLFDAATWSGPLRAFLSHASQGASDKERRKRKRRRGR